MTASSSTETTAATANPTRPVSVSGPSTTVHGSVAVHAGADVEAGKLAGLEVSEGDASGDDDGDADGDADGSDVETDPSENETRAIDDGPEAERAEDDASCQAAHITPPSVRR